KREGQPLDGATVEPDVPDGLAAPLDPEIGDRLDQPKPSSEDAGHGVRFAPDQDENSVTTDPVVRMAPEGESARILGVIAEDRPGPSQGVSDLGTLIPVSREDKGPRIVDQSSLPDAIGHLIPTVKIHGRIAPAVQQTDPVAVALLEAPGV